MPRARHPNRPVRQLALLCGVFAALLAAAGSAAGSAGSSDSIRTRLPFVAAKGPNEYFVVSNLTMPYEKDLSPLLTPAAARSHVSLEALDRYGEMPPVAEATVDSSDIRLVDKNQPATIPEDEKKALEPPAPPVKVAIPSSVATSASILGGLALLIKLIAEMVK